MLPANGPSESELVRWRRVSPLLVLAAHAGPERFDHAAAHQRLNDEVRRLLPHGSSEDRDWLPELREAVIAASEGIATPLDYKDPPAEAILAWREYVLTGCSIRSLGPRISTSRNRIVVAYRAPDRMVRERMWLTDQDPPSKQLTLSAWPGIQRLLLCCEDALGLALPQRLPETDIDAAATDYPLAGDRSDFICDVTIPDGTAFDQGEEFVKTWRIRNAGTVPWVGRYLSRQGGAVGPGTHSSPERVPIPDTDPGQSVDISVPMRAALLPGTSASTWKMTDDEGNTLFPDRYRFGLRCEVVTRGSH